MHTNQLDRKSNIVAGINDKNNQKLINDKKFIYFVINFKNLLMKKMIITLVFCLFALPGIFGQQNVKLAVGMKAPDWMFTDADKKEFTMNSWAGKVLQINYVDPDESESE